MKAAKNVSRRRRFARAASTLSLIALAGCHNDMWVQPKVKPQDQSDVFPDQMASRMLPAHSLDRDHFWTDAERYTGYSNDLKVATTFPFKITSQDLIRGKERFEIFCSPCHGALGNGQGMIAQRGFSLRRQPGNYHTEKLRTAPVGHFYDVITNGFGAMYSYASRVEPDDRWRIAAYIRALQRSQNANISDVEMSRLSPAERKQIDTPPSVNPGGTGANGTPPAPIADTPVPNAPTPNGVPSGVAPPGTPPASAPNMPGSLSPRSAVSPAAPPPPGSPPPMGNPPPGTQPDSAPATNAPPNTPPSGGNASQGGTSGEGRQPTSGAVAPPSGGVNGTSNR